jgi:hypothetical protein
MKWGFGNFGFVDKGLEEKSRVEEALLKVLSFFNLFDRNLLNILYKILVLLGILVVDLANHMDENQNNWLNNWLNIGAKT